MKKRLFCLIMISVIALSFVGCHDKKAEEGTSEQAQEQQEKDEEGEEADEGVVEEFEEGEFGDFE